MDRSFAKVVGSNPFVGLLPTFVSHFELDVNNVHWLRASFYGKQPPEKQTLVPMCHTHSFRIVYGCSPLLKVSSQKLASNHDSLSNSNLRGNLLSSNLAVAHLVGKSLSKSFFFLKF